MDKIQLASEQVVIQAPLSYSGSAKRLWKITRQDHPAAKAGMVTLAVILVVVAWVFVTVWYVVVYVLLGLLAIPYRLLRRSSRKRKAEALRHRETLAAIEHRS